MIWSERKKLKYFDSSNANEIMTNNFSELVLNYFYPLRKIPWKAQLSRIDLKVFE